LGNTEHVGFNITENTGGHFKTSYRRESGAFITGQPERAS
jgi:hypothetical protein